MTRTTPDGTIVAWGMSGVSFCSAWLMFALVLSQAENEMERDDSASVLILSFTGEVSSRIRVFLLPRRLACRAERRDLLLGSLLRRNCAAAPPEVLQPESSGSGSISLIGPTVV